jgi:alkyl hydroperoxide reductase subunit F
MDENLPTKVNDVALPPPTEEIGKKIVIFGTPTCPDCARVKKFFSDNAITYQYIDITTDKKASDWVSSFASFVPVLIMLDGTLKYSPSNEDLHEFIKSTSINQKVEMSEPQQFDVIIIGAGPAGLSAAVYAVRKALKVLVISKDIGGQAAKSGDVENYLGFSMIKGADLMVKFKEDVEQFQGEGLWLKEGVEVTGVEGEESNFTVKAGTNEYHGRTVIIASGRVPRMLGIKGEKEFFGRGVATCATCDAPLFQGREVAVIGGGNSAIDAAYSLLKLAKSVKIINIGEQLKGDEVMLKNVTGASNVEVFNNTSTLEITGDKFVTGLKVQNKETHQEQVLPVDGVFVEIGWVPAVDFVPQLAKDKQNQIMVDEFGLTNVPGIWAAGDVNNLWGEQIIIAAGEGAKVALSVAEHIAKIPHQATSNTHEG